MAEEAPQVTLDLEHIKEESKDETAALGDVFTERISSLMKHRDVDAVLSDQQHMWVIAASVWPKMLLLSLQIRQFRDDEWKIKIFKFDIAVALWRISDSIQVSHETTGQREEGPGLRVQKNTNTKD